MQPTLARKCAVPLILQQLHFGTQSMAYTMTNVRDFCGA
jgi:hypothetical protein